MQDYRKLKVWRKAHELALAVYEVTARFPRVEIYGLTSQMRRAASSVPSNIVEGCGRGTNAELMRFLYIALGSANEIEYQLLFARDLGFLPPEAHDRLG
jgi:four helix bundle protein